ncbi:heptaprenyl diphosphate synthase component 2-like [Symsagittifera roscoffensis]|uniref:heptaprenyl diphosphate synthase component 2-like n=1 Tax=Symsagittifera roscoffensis TaxID=84072 RepID=UPI00307BCBA6
MLIKNVVSNLMQSGGKRIRPLFVLAFNKLCSNSIPEDLNIIAASIEYIHTATLLHDDVIDNSDSRRGKSTAQKLWGSKASVLVGDFLLSTAFKWLVSSNNSEILKIVSETSVAISRGEIKQLVSKLDFNSHTYYDVIRSKTAVLFAASCEIGAVAGGANYEQRCAAYEFGLNFGIAFQIIDDIMDYVGTETGKPSGADFMNSRITLPLILAYQE